MVDEFQKSITLITSSDPDVKKFGTGFSIYQSRGLTYILTCAHVVADVGGENKVKVDNRVSTLIDINEAADIAILKVEGLDKPPLSLQGLGLKDKFFLTAGFQVYDKRYLLRPLTGSLGQQGGLKFGQDSDLVQTWDLLINDDYKLQPGYSGSPVVDKASGEVIGIVSSRQGEGDKGLAISIEAMKYLRNWQPTDSGKLFKSLLSLGYDDQDDLFFEIVNEDFRIASFWIHGLPEHGQRWLLNRLVLKHVPFYTSSKIIIVKLERKGRGIDIESLRRELCGRLGVDRNLSLVDIADRVYHWWTTQNVIFVFHDVNCILEDTFQKLVEAFWVHLARRVQSDDIISKFKLLMFLVDYEGCTENWCLTETPDLDAKISMPVRSDKISKFSKSDLKLWIRNSSRDLPQCLTKEVDKTVKTILENSDNGIPEGALAEIYDRCGCDWYEVEDKRFKL